MCAASTFRLARTSRCAIVVSGTRNARAIDAVDRPLTTRKVSATCASRAKRGVAAEEDEAELIVGHGVAVDVGLGVAAVPAVPAAPPLSPRSVARCSRRGAGRLPFGAPPS